MYLEAKEKIEIFIIRDIRHNGQRLAVETKKE